MEVAFKHRWTGGREEISTRATCPECGRHHYVKSFSARATCPYCKEHPLPLPGRGASPNDTRYKRWALVEDKSPEDCRFSKGARFTDFDVDWMEKLGTIAPGSKFRHVTSKKVRVIKEVT